VTHGEKISRDDSDGQYVAIFLEMLTAKLVTETRAWTVVYHHKDTGLGISPTVCKYHVQTGDISI